MPHLTFEQPLKKLEPRRGGYYYLTVAAETVELFERKKATRLKCILEKEITLSCGLNHLGDGNFFLIVAGKHVKKLHLEEGDQVAFEIYEDPNPLGVEVPEALEVLLAQDPVSKSQYDALTDGKKRSLIFSIQKIKSIDKQVEKALKFLAGDTGMNRRK
ncbi:MAG: YdeI/OmpD-associated family protein [Bacteroidota bacterium]